MSARDRTDLASRLRQRITLQQPVEATDSGGGVTKTWQNVATVWAEMVPLRGDERVIAEQLPSVVVYRVTIRYRDDVQPSWRIQYKGKSLNIRATMNADERNAALILVAEEGVGD